MARRLLSGASQKLHAAAEGLDSARERAAEKAQDLRASMRRSTVDPSGVVDWSLPSSSGAPLRSHTVQEGVSLLKRGVRVTKFGREGVPHPATVKLSQDERELSWTSAATSKKMRKVALSDVMEVWVGHESHVFKRHVRECFNEGRPSEAAPHQSCSLLLRSTLPPPPGSALLDLPLEAESADAAAAPRQERETLDVSCADDEAFGLLVAALRSLLAEQRDAAEGLAARAAAGPPPQMAALRVANPPPPPGSRVYPGAAAPAPGLGWGAEVEAAATERAAAEAEAAELELAIAASLAESGGGGDGGPHAARLAHAARAGRPG